MKITKKIVDVQRHTKAYVINGQRVTRGAAVKMVRRGKISGLFAKQGPDGWYITASGNSPYALYELPEVVE
jgi:hypothetical protein